MERKPKSETYIEPMPKRQLHSLISKFKQSGGKVYMDDAATAYLDIKGAEACTLNESTILFRKRPSRSAVFEELFHVQQFRDGKIDGTVASICKCEIEAKSYLLDNSKELGLTPIEIAQTQNELLEYKRILNEQEDTE